MPEEAMHGKEEVPGAGEAVVDQKRGDAAEHSEVADVGKCGSSKPGKETAVFTPSVSGEQSFLCRDQAEEKQQVHGHGAELEGEIPYVVGPSGKDKANQIELLCELQHRKKKSQDIQKLLFSSGHGSRYFFSLCLFQAVFRN